MKAFCRLWIEGQMLDLGQRLLALQVVDKDGMQADMMTLDLDDHDGAFAFPNKGQLIGLELGHEEALAYRGRFIVDEISHRGAPDVLTIRASSADFGHHFLEERECSYHEVTLGNIVGAVAARQGLGLQIDATLAAYFIEHLDQTNESDAHFMTRLAEEFHAIGTVKDGHLLFHPRGSRGLMAYLQRSDGDQHEYSERDREERVTGAVAYYQDKKSAQRKTYVAGGGGYRRHLKQTYRSLEEAKTAAESALKRAQRRAKSLRFDLAYGRPDLSAEMQLKVQGFKAEIDAVDWVIAEVRHELNEQGLRSSIMCDTHEALER